MFERIHNAIAARWEALAAEFNSVRRVRRSAQSLEQWFKDGLDAAARHFDNAGAMIETHYRNGIIALKGFHEDVMSGATAEKIREYFNSLDLNLDFIDDIAQTVGPYTTSLLNGIEDVGNDLRETYGEFLKRPEIVDMTAFVDNIAENYGL